MRRSDFGRWDFIAGGPEEGESLTSMIIREAAEEAGITVERPVPFGFCSDPGIENITYPNGVFALMYCCDLFYGEPRSADNETTELD